MGGRAVLFRGRAEPDMRAATNQGRGAGFLGRFNGGFNFIIVVSVDALHIPAVSFVALWHIFGKRQVRAAVDRDAVLIVQDNQFGQVHMPGEGGGFVADSFHKVAVARKHIGIVVDQIIPVTLVQDTLRQRKSGGGRNALPQGACRHFNSGIDVIFWMSGRNGAHLAKIFDFLQCHFLIARQVAKRIKQHGAVPAGQNKTVPVGPAWIFRIEF